MPDQPDTQTTEEQNASALEQSLLAGFNRARGIEDTEQPEREPAPGADDTPAAEEPAAGGDQQAADEPKKVVEPPPPPPPDDPLDKRFRRLEGQFGSVNRDLQKITKQLEGLASAATAAAGAKTPTQAELNQPDSAEKTAYLKREYPEFSEALEEQMTLLAGRIPDADALKKAAEAQAVETGRVMRELTRIDRAAETRAERGDWASDDWQATIYSDEFTTWLATQDADMKAKRESDFGRDVVECLDAFERSRKTPAQPKDPTPAPPRGQRLEDAVPATTGSGPTRSERQPSIEEAMVEGFKRARGEL